MGAFLYCAIGLPALGGGKIPADAVVCMLCGRQVEQMAQGSAPNIVINNANQNTNSNVNAYVAAKARNKWAAL